MKIFWNIIKFSVFFGLVFVIIFSMFNWPAVSADLKYYWQNLSPRAKQKANQSFLPQIKLANKSAEQATVQSLNLPNNHIIIKKLNLDVPIVWNSPENKFIDNLKNGVGHFQGTAKPGQKGNIFIAGHSSSYWWERGPYSAIFSMINKLDAGNEIIITYNNKIYLYRVTKKFVVRPSQVDVMYPTQEPTLTLMTCTPIGTALNRLIIRAVQISP